jgi:hypothetical protein
MPRSELSESHRIVIEEFRSVVRGTLPGFGPVRFPSGLIVDEIGITSGPTMVGHGHRSQVAR